jgi:hypothetical protein
MVPTAHSKEYGSLFVRRLLKPLWMVLAVVFLVEAWLWDRLAPIVAWLVGRLPWERLKAGIAALVQRLPAWAVLGVFLVPVGLILPFKLAGVWLIAHRHVVLGAATFIAAKGVGLGVTAFLFDVTRDKLLTMAWFARFYARVLWARDWAHRQVDPAKQQIAAFLRSIGVGGDSRLKRRWAMLRQRARKTFTS